MKKSIDVIAQRILAIGISFAMILGVALFGFASISNNSAKADSPNTVNNLGKYQMSATGFEISGKPVYNILVWDSETGKSKIYTYANNGEMISATFKLPSSPIY
jgi:hypothetical protein